MSESSADRTPSTDPALLTSDEVRGLLEEGREQGYLEGAHIASALRDVDLTAEQLEEIHDVFAELGIDVIEGDAGTPDESPEPKPKRKSPPSSISR